MSLYPTKVVLTIATLAALMTGPDYIPYFKDYKVLDWSFVPKVLDFAPRARDGSPVEAEQLRLHPNTDVNATQLFQLQDPSNNMKAFYKALFYSETKQGEGITRILHYGDSPTTADLITSDTRALLQKQFGDAGHGFVLIGKPWEWYNHQGIDLEDSGWEIEPASKSNIKDGQFGLGGVSFFGQPGSAASIRVKDKTHGWIEVSYLDQPGGGSFVLYGDKSPIARITTNSAATKPGFATYAVHPGISEYSIGQVEGRIRLYGVRLGRNNPGVVYSSLGVNGAYISVLAKMFGEEHWAAQLRQAAPHLVVINYGTNESVYPSFVNKTFERELKLVIERIRKAVPESSILVMSPMDRGQHMSSGEIGSVPALTKLVTMEQTVATENNCAFFNTFEAMGGPGTMGRWYQSEPRLVGADLIHPKPAGAKLVGNLLFKALLDGYTRYKVELVREKYSKVGASEEKK